MNNKNRHLHKMRTCKVCWQHFATDSLPHEYCLSCQAQLQELHQQVPRPDQEVVFAMCFTKKGDKQLYRSFTVLDTYQTFKTEIQKQLQRKIDTICALDVHNVYNTGGLPTSSAHLYIPLLQNLPSTTLRVLISYMKCTSLPLRVNVTHYARTAFQQDAIDLCFLVYTRTANKVEKTVNMAQKLTKMSHGTKTGVLHLLDDICSPVIIKLADDGRDHCSSVSKSLASALVFCPEKTKGKGHVCKNVSAATVDLIKKMIG